MTTTTFIDTDTFEILNYTQLKEHPSWPSPFPYMWPSNPMSGNIDTFINNFPEATVARFYETNPPAHELWETAEHGIAPDNHYYIDENDGNKYKRKWVIRNLTQQELDDLNEQRKQMVDMQRSMAYQMESDPLFFKSQRGESTSEEWMDKIAEIKELYPNPVIITIPE